MSWYEVTAPDGQVYDVEAPEGATEEQVLAYAQANYKPAAPAPRQPDSKSQRFMQGMRDPVNALGQLLHNALPAGVSGPINRADQWLFENTGGLMGTQADSFDERVRQEGAEYNAPEGFDWMRLGGNVVGAAPVAAAASAAAAPLTAKMGTSMGARVLQGAGQGGLLGLTAPAVGEGDFATEKLQQGLLGAGTGGGMVPVAAGVGRVIQPLTREPIKRLMREGITPSPGQIMGNGIRFAEEKMRSIPILGDMIARAHNQTRVEFNRSLYNRILDPIKGRFGALPDVDRMPTGHAGMKALKNTFDRAYDDIKQRSTFQADDQFRLGMKQVESMLKYLPKRMQASLRRELRERLYNRMTPSGRMSGESFKAADSTLNDLAQKYKPNMGYDERQAHDAIREVRRLMLDTVKRSNPGLADDYASLQNSYSLYKIAERAHKYANTTEALTPAQLDAAVRAEAAKAGYNTYAYGNARLQDLADMGKEIAQTYPDSGTPGRLFMGGLGLYGLNAIEPTAAMGAVGGSLLYTDPMQKLIAQAMTNRGSGQLAGLLSQGARETIPYAGALAATRQ